MRKTTSPYIWTCADDMQTGWKWSIASQECRENVNELRSAEERQPRSEKNNIEREYYKLKAIGVGHNFD